MHHISSNDPVDATGSVSDQERAVRFYGFSHPAKSAFRKRDLDLSSQSAIQFRPAVNYGNEISPGE
jgi:hypothetical protein